MVDTGGVGGIDRRTHAFADGPGVTSNAQNTARTLLSRGRALVRRIRGLFPFTVLGTLLALLAGSALAIYAYDERDLVAFLLSGVVLALLGIAAVITGITAIVLGRLHRDGESGRAITTITTDEVETGFRLPSLGFVPLVSLDAEVVEPAGVSRRFESDLGRLHERLRFDSRGRHARFTRRLAIGDVFGLCRVDFLRTEIRDAIVIPHFGRLDRLPTLRSLAHGDELAHPMGTPDGDRLDVRRYAPGDPARFIHWKAFARTGKVVVRVPERAVATSERVVAYQVSGHSDDPSAAAALAALTFGALGSEWTFGADGTPAPIRDLDSARIAVATSAAYRHDGARDLETFLRTVQREGPVSLILFVPPTEGVWLDRVLAMPREALPLRIVIGVDSVVDDRPRSVVTRTLRLDQPLVGTSRTELDRVRAKLASLRGSDVVVVERPTGRVLASGGRTSIALSGAAA